MALNMKQLELAMLFGKLSLETNIKPKSMSPLNNHNYNNSNASVSFGHTLLVNLGRPNTHYPPHNGQYRLVITYFKYSLTSIRLKSTGKSISLVFDINKTSLPAASTVNKN